MKAQHATGLRLGDDPADGGQVAEGGEAAAGEVEPVDVGAPRRRGRR